jgi:hypothetical protein
MRPRPIPRNSRQLSLAGVITAWRYARDDGRRQDRRLPKGFNAWFMAWMLHPEDGRGGPLLS